jgi:hypothetical protein
VLAGGHHFLTGDRGHWLRQFDRAKGLEWRCREELPCINAIATTRDGARAVYAGHDHSGIIDLRSKQARHFQGSGPGHVVALTPDESTALIGAGALLPRDEDDVESGVIRAWSLETCRPAYRLRGHRGPVTSIAVCQGPGESRAVSGSADRTLIVWDLKTRRMLRVLSGHTGRVRGVAATPDGKRAVSASSDRTLRLWDLADGRELSRVEGDTEFTACAIAGDGRHVVAGDGHGRILFLEMH